jgi:hypothetical protein
MNENNQSLLSILMMLGAIKLIWMVAGDFAEHLTTIKDGLKAKIEAKSASKMWGFDHEYAIQRIRDGGFTHFNLMINDRQVCQVVPDDALPGSALVQIVVRIPDEDVPAWMRGKS